MVFVPRSDRAKEEVGAMASARARLRSVPGAMNR